jgi:hypothetical protein
MNTNETSPKDNGRMGRIQKFSTALRTFFFFTAMLAGLGGISEISYGLGFRQPVPIWAGVVNLAWAAGLWFAYRLFMFYARGELFGAGIVRCLRRIGSISILIGILECVSSVIQVSNLEPRPLNFWSVSVPLIILQSFFRIIPGFAIICIAWIMDEGRKIQEEQELTV